MKIQTRIFLGIFIIIAIGFSLMLLWLINDLKPQYRKITEEPLVDTSQILASVASATSHKGKINVEMFRKIFMDVYSKSFSAKVYDFEKQYVDFRVYITDINGKVIFDSNDGKDEGKDYSQWIDVKRTLQGEYGARTSQDIPGNISSVHMYIAAPITINGKLAGVLSVGKPTKTANQFAKDSKKKIITLGIIVSFSVVLIGLILSWMITAPISRLTVYAKAVRDSKRTQLPKLGKSEIKELGLTLDGMRNALEGKQYIENYVQTLTHEIKSPLSAIQGALELLNEEMPLEQRTKFLSNVKEETERIRVFIEKLLLLSSLESKNSIQDTEQLNMKHIVADVKQSMMPILTAKKITFEINGNDTIFEGDSFLVRQAIMNLVQNAIDFSSEAEKITASISTTDKGYVMLTIRDNGSGIPDYALDKIYNRFYSLKRPSTGRKSSGLGLSLVREVTLLHQGNIQLENAPDGGTIATLTLPLKHI